MFWNGGEGAREGPRRIRLVQGFLFNKKKDSAFIRPWEKATKESGMRGQHIPEEMLGAKELRGAEGLWPRFRGGPLGSSKICRKDGKDGQELNKKTKRERKGKRDSILASTNGR